MRPPPPLLQMIFAVMLGASCAFATPIGTQTNLMVLSAGGYGFGDFMRVGSLLTLVVGAAAALFIWLLQSHLDL